MQKKLLSARQYEFLASSLCRINLLYGSVRSGKTWISLIKWAVFVAASPQKSEFLMAAKTFTALKRNCLNLLERLVGENNFTYTISAKKAQLFGRTVWLEGAADARAEAKIRGMTLHGAYLDELSLIPREFYLMTLSRLSDCGAALIATTNPESKNNFVYTDIIKNTCLDKAEWLFLLDDNIFLTEKYKRSIKAEYTGVFYRRFVLGEFCAAEGAVYTDFANNKAAFVTTAPDYDYIQVGVDFGGNASAHSFTACGLTNDCSALTALMSRRVCAKGSTPEDLYREFGAFADTVKQKYGVITCVYADSAEQLLISGLKARYPRLVFKNARKKPITDRIRATTALMAKGRFFITQDCSALAAAFENAVYDSAKAADVRLDNGTSDIDSLDSFEYAWERQMQRYTVNNH